MTFLHTALPDYDRRAFLNALHDWAGKPQDSFSLTLPPCNQVRGSDENLVLAGIFRAIASDYPMHDATRALCIVQSAIDTHTRRHAMLWQDAKGTHPGQPTRRTTWIEVRQYEAMLNVLCMWHDALFDQFMNANGALHSALPHLELEIAS